MKRLTDDAYWDSVHRTSAPGAAPLTLETPFRRWLLRIGRSYTDEHFWRLLARHLKPGPLKVIEIGSAPGEFLKQCHTRFIVRIELLRPTPKMKRKSSVEMIGGHTT